jgi:hypothetical protein
MTDHKSITIRRTGDLDWEALRRLAQLDSKRLPGDDFLIAEIAGEPVAAIGVRSGAVVADPFRRTADVADLLRLRAERVRCAEAPSRPLLHPLRRLAASRGAGRRGLAAREAACG